MGGWVCGWARANWGEGGRRASWRAGDVHTTTMKRRVAPPPASLPPSQRGSACGELSNLLLPLTSAPPSRASTRPQACPLRMSMLHFHATFTQPRLHYCNVHIHTVAFNLSCIHAASVKPLHTPSSTNTSLH